MASNPMPWTAYRENIWPMGATFEPHWCLVLSLDTRLPALE
jgi:hypothetical protein